MLDVRAFARAFQPRSEAEAEMSSEPESIDSAAARLEAALERIARAATATPIPPAAAVASAPDLAGALDRIIVRLRDALNGMD
jgi:broad specificity phosphatase PhoE